MDRKETTSRTALQEEIGFSRAVRIGHIIAVSGTAPILPDGSTAYIGDLYQQTRFCLEIIMKAIGELGGKKEQVLQQDYF